MREQSAFLIVKRIICIFMLLLYVSGVQQFFCNGILSLAYLLLMFVIVIIMLPDIWKEGKSFKEKPKTLILIPLGILLVFLLDQVLMQNIVQPMLWEIAGATKENANTERVFEMIRKNLLFMIFLSCIIGPVLEEILYRYTVFGLIGKKNKPLAHIITALLFGIQHVIDAGVYGGDAKQFLNIGSYIMFSFIMSGVYSKTKNLCIPIIIHITTNSIGVTVMLLQYFN
jgi:membrane protease YdiL (CAAX protease family)